MKLLKKSLCLLLVLSILVASFACKKAENKEERVPAESAASAVPTAVPESAPSATEETTSPTEEATSPTEEPPETANDTATEAFLALDKELFVWYVTQDITYLDQYVVNPAAYGIDVSSVPVTMGEFTEAGNEKWCGACEKYLAALTEIDRNALDEQNMFAYDVIRQYLNYELMSKDLFYYYEPLEQYVGFQTNLPLTFGLYVFRDVADVENYLTLMADVPRYVQQIIDFEKKRAEMGIFMTESALDAILLDCQSMIDAKETCYLYDTFAEELDTLPGLSDKDKEAYIQRSNELVAGSFIAAYQMLYDALEALRPMCRDDVGMCAINAEAKEYFAACLKRESSSALEPKQAADLLVKYADSSFRNAQYLYASDSTLWDRYYNSETVSCGSIEENIAYLKQLIPAYMPELPEVNVDYHEIPAEMQDSFSPAAYLVPSIDGWKDNKVLINPANDADLMMLAHEAYPGHMFQFVYQRASDNQSLFQRLVSPIGYEEGWTTNVELSISKRADAFDTSYCLFVHYMNYFYYCIAAACCIYVNYMDYTLSDLTDFLSDRGYGEAAATFYQDAVNNPIYYFKYALGYCLQQEVYAHTYDVYPFTDLEFYTAYLDLGAGYFNLVEPAMLSWAESKNA